MTDHESSPGSLKQPLPGALEVVLDDRSAETIYKQDRRSKVWLTPSTDHDREAVVVKRFEYSPTRQLLAKLLGVHPGQRELRANRWLAAKGIAVVPIIANGCQRAGRGGKLWLVTPKRGKSLQSLLREDPPLSRPLRQTVIESVGRLAGQLLRAGVFFKDLKTSNILIDETGQAWLIDVGSARPMGLSGRADRMLAMLEKTAAQDGAKAADRLRCLRIIAREAGRAQGHKAMARAITRRLGL
jgi:tRNA A-37 threonylcarbamoyl transferase component Bud32